MCAFAQVRTPRWHFRRKGRKPLHHEALLFKVLGDPLRLRLAVLLARAGEACVCHLALAVEEPSYKVSRHLGLLRSAGLVETRRSGSWIHCRLAPPAAPLAAALHRCLLEGLADHPAAEDDERRLREGLSREC